MTHVHVHMYTYTYTPVYIRTYTYACTPTRVHIHVHTCIPTHLHVRMYRYVITYMYVWEREGYVSIAAQVPTFTMSRRIGEGYNYLIMQVDSVSYELDCDTLQQIIRHQTKLTPEFYTKTFKNHSQLQSAGKQIIYHIIVNGRDEIFNDLRGTLSP